MPRQLRNEYEFAFYHLTTRGNNRHKLFFDSKDFIIFLSLFSDTIREFEWICYDYNMMHNHYHTSLCTPKPNLSAGLQKLHSKYSHYFRKRYLYSGRLFEVYDPSSINNDSYVLEAIRYDLLNPVRAGLVTHPKDWQWSSYAETAGFINPSGWVDINWVRSMFGDNSTPAKHFIEFINSGIANPK